MVNFLPCVKSQEGYISHNLFLAPVIQFQVEARRTHRDLRLQRRTAEDVGGGVKALGQGVHAPISNTATKKLQGITHSEGGRTGQRRQIIRLAVLLLLLHEKNVIYQ